MPDSQTVKVYELAKELGLDSIALLGELKTLSIQVKSHMSDLNAADADRTRVALRKGLDPSASMKKAAPKPRKKAEPVPAPVIEKKAPAPVIRRRTRAEEPEVSKSFESPPPEQLEVAGSRASVLAEEETPQSVAIADTPEKVELSAEPQPESSPGHSEAPASLVEGASVRPKISLPPRPVAPRRSILKIVEVTAPPQRPVIQAAPPNFGTKPGVKGPVVSQPDKEGFRIIKMTKENLDQMVEEEAAKKRGGGRLPEIKPEDVRFADYRKKEMIFLPKKKKLPIGKEVRKTQKTVAKAQKRVVTLQDSIAIHDLADQMGQKATDVIRKLMGMGLSVSMNSSVDFETAALVGQEYGYEVRNDAFDEEALINIPTPSAATGVSRPPVVTIMGHVDHGKTTLLDSIRQANVAGGEAGGITQHIGAYTVVQDGHEITFIDTPGHEAFTVMRARGASVTDIVVLVVSADDGVMPQTREAISHAKAAGVPIIVAVNKMDKPGAQPDKVMQALADLDLLSEAWGGQTIFVPVSALKKTNLNKLLEAILLQAEILDLKADPKVRAQGVVLEARLEKGRGPVVSVLIRQGTLSVGDAIVAGPFAGKVKALTDHLGRGVKAGRPGTAVEILGFEGVPSAGEILNSPENESDARLVASNRLDKNRAKISGVQSKMSLEDLFSKIQSGETKELTLILKGDAFGTTEAIRDSLVKLSNEQVKIKVILCATGGITESDVLLATASNALIIGFNVRPETKARQLAVAEHIEIKSYSVIYEIFEDVKKAMTGLLDKTKVERFLGRAEVRQIFSVPKIGTVAGSAVIDGKILRGASVRLLRESRIIYEGRLSSLRRFKDDAKEVASGFECGIGIENYNDLKPGDLIEAYQIDLVAGELHGSA